MISSNTPTWFTDFFSAENQIQTNKPHTNNLLNTVYPLVLDSISKPNTQLPYFLASFVNDDLYFYGFSASRKGLLELNNAIYFALGTSHTTSQKLVLSPEFSFEESILEFYSNGCIKFKLSNSDGSKASIESSTKVVETLVQIAKRFELKPSLNVDRKRPIGRILRDFFVSTRDRHVDLTKQYLQEAKTSSALSNRNIISLELQAFGIQQDWESILSHGDLLDYLDGIVPVRINHLLIRALKNANNLDENKLEKIHFELLKTSLEKYQPFLTKKPNLSVDAKYISDWKGWIIMVLSLGANDIEDHIPSFIEKSWLIKIQEQLLDEKHELQIRQTFSEKLTEYLELAPTEETAIKVLNYSKNCSTVEVPVILNWLEDLTPAIRKKVKEFAPNRKLWNELEEHIYGTCNSEIEAKEGQFDVNEKPVKSHSISWNDWFSTTEKRTFNPDALLESSIEEFDIRLITENIKACNEPEKIRNISPILLSWIEENSPKTNSAFWLSLIELISIDEQTSYTTVVLLKDLIEKLLEVPHSGNDYSEAIESFVIVSDNEISKRTLPVIVEFIEILFNFAIKDESALKFKLWSSVSGYILKNWENIEFELKGVILWIDSQIFAETSVLSHLSLKDDLSDEANSLNLEGKTVGISTLTEKAGQRAASILEELFPGIKIILNHDKVATEQLKHLAKTADFFIFCNKSAAHQAYYAVKEINKEIIYPEGKGSSSIIRALVEQFKN